MFIHREAREIMYLVASIHLSVPTLTTEPLDLRPTLRSCIKGQGHEVHWDIPLISESLVYGLAGIGNSEIHLVGIGHGVFSKCMQLFLVIFQY